MRLNFQNITLILFCITLSLPASAQPKKKRKSPNVSLNIGKSINDSTSLF